VQLTRTQLRSIWYQPMNIKLGMNGRPWWRFDRGRVPRNPFDPVLPIQHLEFCKVCQMDVDTQAQAAWADGVYVYRKLCKRCGSVMVCGIDRRELVSSKPLPKEAIQFIRETGRDRR